MKTSLNLSCTTRKFGDKKAIELHKKAGFEAFDFSCHAYVDYDWQKDSVKLLDGHPILSKDGVKYAKELKKYADDLGISCTSSHSPFPSTPKSIQDYFKWAIEITATLGGKITVVHPICFTTVEKNAELYKSILPFAKEFGVKIACENMWAWNNDPAYNHATTTNCSHHDDFLAHVNAVNDDYLVACLDIGHAEMKGLNTSSIDMIKTLKNKIEILHIHDNDKWHDDHASPFTMNIDFAIIMQELKKIGYKGDVTLEIDTNFANDSEETALYKLTDLANKAKMLKEMLL